MKERVRRRERAWREKETARRPLCREVFTHGCGHDVAFSRLRPTTSSSPLPFPPPPPPIRCTSWLRPRRRGSKSVLRAKAAEISLASLRFGIRGSWGASNLLPGERVGNFFFHSFSSGHGPRVKSAENVSGRKSLLAFSAGNPAPCFSSFIAELVLARTRCELTFFPPLPPYIARISFCTSAFFANLVK